MALLQAPQHFAPALYATCAHANCLACSVPPTVAVQQTHPMHEHCTCASTRQPPGARRAHPCPASKAHVCHGSRWRLMSFFHLPLLHHLPHTREVPPCQNWASADEASAAATSRIVHSMARVSNVQHRHHQFVLLLALLQARSLATHSTPMHGQQTCCQRWPWGASTRRSREAPNGPNKLEFRSARSCKHNAHSRTGTTTSTQSCDRD